jgi:hypothetical protein
MECTICYDKLESTNLLSNPKDSSQIGFCLNCLNYMIENNFSRYIKEIGKADCEKSLSSALAHPIPLFITANSLKSGTQIEELVCGTEIIFCKLVKPIDDLVLYKLNQELGVVKSQMSDPTFDYLEQIAKLLSFYGLDGV